VTAPAGTDAGKAGAAALLRARRGAEAWAQVPRFTKTAWLKAVGASALSRKDMLTAADMADTATSRGISKATRTQLAQMADVNRDATISARWKKMRAAGLMTSKARFNKPSLHALTMPDGIGSVDPLDFYIADLPEMVLDPAEFATWHLYAANSSGLEAVETKTAH
jgi:acyl-CoA reductase-like NAD-dependent aldehyde dehydrogenase